MLDPSSMGAIPGDLPMGGDMARFTPDRLVTDPDAIFEPAYFAYDSAQIAASEAQKVARVGDYMRRNTQYALLIDGHCDERGSSEYNQSLGERRALAARAYLVGLGIPAESIQTRSFGEEKPVDPGHDEGAWQKNRRAEFGIYR
jgi:peptidoglycan-associated lipoprotein